jgi:hypothetical protein
VGIDSAAARAELDRLKAEDIKVSGNVDLDDAAATAKIDRLRSKDADVHGNYDLDIGAAEAKIELLKRQAAGIGGGIGGGVGRGAVGAISSVPARDPRACSSTTRSSRAPRRRFRSCRPSVPRPLRARWARERSDSGWVERGP